MIRSTLARACVRDLASFRVVAHPDRIEVTPTLVGWLRLRAFSALSWLGARLLDLACRAAPVPVHLTITVDPPEASPTHGAPRAPAS